MPRVEFALYKLLFWISLDKQGLRMVGRDEAVTLLLLRSCKFIYQMWQHKNLNLNAGLQGRGALRMQTCRCYCVTFTLG
jgi:hypothetical protein